MDRSVLEQVALTSVQLTVYRHVHPDHEKYAWSPVAGKPNSNRFATNDGTLYAADSQAVVWAEICRAYSDAVSKAKPRFASSPMTAREMGRYGHLSLEGPDRCILEIRIEFTKLADFTNTSNRALLVLAGFPLSDFTTNRVNQYGLCNELASIGESLGWEGLRAPSAALPGYGSTIAVFLVGQAQIQGWSVLSVYAPTVALAVAARYRDGQKPSWVP